MGGEITKKTIKIRESELKGFEVLVVDDEADFVDTTIKNIR
jgi:hypothetical protein